MSGLAAMMHQKPAVLGAAACTLAISILSYTVFLELHSANVQFSKGAALPRPLVQALGPQEKALLNAPGDYIAQSSKQFTVVGSPTAFNSATKGPVALRPTGASISATRRPGLTLAAVLCAMMTAVTVVTKWSRRTASTNSVSEATWMLAAGSGIQELVFDVEVDDAKVALARSEFEEAMKRNNSEAATRIMRWEMALARKSLEEELQQNNKDAAQRIALWDKLMREKEIAREELCATTAMDEIARIAQTIGVQKDDFISRYLSKPTFTEPALKALFGKFQVKVAAKAAKAKKAASAPAQPAGEEGPEDFLDRWLVKPTFREPELKTVYAAKAADGTAVPEEVEPTEVVAARAIATAVSVTGAASLMI